MVRSVSTLVELCDTAVGSYGDRPAFGTRSGGRWEQVSFREFGQRVARCRGALTGLGVRPGDRVAIVSNNRLEWAVAAYATFGLRAVFVPLYEAQPAKEWAFILGDSGAKVVLASATAFGGIAAIAAELPQLEHVIGLDLPVQDPQGFARLMDASAEAGPAEVRPGDLAGIIYTSGTTGAPKGVLLTHQNFCANVNAVLASFTLDREVSLSFLPWAHAFGQTADLHTLLAAGTHIHLNDEIARLLENLAEVRPTVLCAVPRIFNRIYDRVNQRIAERPGFIRALFRTGLAASRKRRSVGSIAVSERLTLAAADKLIFSSIRRKLGGRLKFVVSGSAALNKEVAEFMAALGVSIYEGYGLTEAAPVVSVNCEGRLRIGSVGPPLPGVRVVIDRSATADAREGEIVVYGDNVMAGYHNRPEESAERLGPDGGLRTGDIGYLDEDGFLHITGRIKEQYKLENGKYVVPSPLEEQLKLCPHVANVFIYGENRPHNVALVVPDEEALTRWARQLGIELVGRWRDPRVRELIAAELEDRGTGMRSFERPKAFALLDEDFTVENGLLTPSLKLRRDKVMTKYRTEIEGLYGS